ncbi:MAG: cobalamin biosynthesis protein [Xenococcaceae cyanobacterium]
MSNLHNDVKTNDRETLVQSQARIWDSATRERLSETSDFPKVKWHPRVLWVGIGCKKGTSKTLIQMAIEQTCQRYHLATEAIAGIATIDLKANEPGILEICRAWNLPLKIFSAETLNRVKVSTPSQTIDKKVGTPSVAEAAAILASLDRSLPITNSLLVSKQIFKQENEPGVVTIAIADSKCDRTKYIS